MVPVTPFCRNEAVTLREAVIITQKKGKMKYERSQLFIDSNH